MHLRKTVLTDLFEIIEELGRRLSGWEATRSLIREDRTFQGQDTRRRCRKSTRIAIVARVVSIHDRPLETRVDTENRFLTS
jgi:hypothetical protein